MAVPPSSVLKLHTGDLPETRKDVGPTSLPTPMRECKGNPYATELEAYQCNYLQLYVLYEYDDEISIVKGESSSTCFSSFLAHCEREDKFESFLTVISGEMFTIVGNSDKIITDHMLEMHVEFLTFKDWLKLELQSL